MKNFERSLSSEKIAKTMVGWETSWNDDQGRDMQNSESNGPLWTSDPKSGSGRSQGDEVHQDDPGPLLDEPEIHVPLIMVRRFVRHKMGYESAWAMSERFVRFAPLRVQRHMENLIDYPIASHIRSAPVLLIRVPKTASLSLSGQIYGRVTHVPHRTALFYKRSDPVFFSSLPSFAVVRNPWDRLLSAYNYLRQSGTLLSRPNPQTQSKIAKIPSFDHFVFDYLSPHEFTLERLDPTVHSQHAYVCDTIGNIIVDRLFHFEKIDEVQDFLNLNGIVSPPRHINRSQRSVGPTVMSAKIIEEIGRIYATDVTKFGYHPP